MFNNISKEIVLYSVVPVAVIALLIIVLLLFGKKKNNNYFEYNYSIKILLSILITFILSIMIGYTAWVYERISGMSAVSQNILYLSLLAVLVISLFLSLIFMFFKLYKDLKPDNEEENNLEEKEFQN